MTVIREEMHMTILFCCHVLIISPLVLFERGATATPRKTGQRASTMEMFSPKRSNNDRRVINFGRCL